MTEFDQQAGSTLDDVSVLRLLYVAPNGAVRAESVAADSIDDALSAGVRIPADTHWQTVLGDVVAGCPGTELVLQPDQESFRQFPFAEQSGGVLCSVETPDGTPWPADPRAVLSDLTRSLSDRGLTVSVGIETEFYLCNDDTESVAGDTATATTHDFVTAVRSNLSQQAIAVAEYRPEWGTDEHVLRLERQPAPIAADQQVFAVETIHSVASNRGRTATMVPFPTTAATSSARYRLSLDVDSTATAELAGDTDRLIESFLAGLLAHARGLVAVTTGTVNSYIRLQPTGGGPTHSCWSREDPTALVRLPSAGPNGPIPLELEFRGADPTANPYIALIGLLGAGLDGIERALTSPPPIDSPDQPPPDTPTPLPETLSAGLSALANDAVLTDALGDRLTECYLAVKRRQWQTFCEATAMWEADRFRSVY